MRRFAQTAAEYYNNPISIISGAGGGMHIQDGILPLPVIVAGSIGAAAAVGVGLARMSEREMVKVAVLSSSLFVASQIHITFGAASVHLILNGLSGLLLGWSIYPALAVALLLQAILFSHGG
ncbi:MAG: energy-coupling factor ABC transporter permease, partial [Candidatus Hydrogenedentota bacterium]